MNSGSVKSLLSALAALAPLCLNGCASPPTTELTEVEKGAIIYRDLCASCHGDDATGNGAAAEHLIVKPADLTRIAARRNGRFPTQEIAEYIDGRLSTPPRGEDNMPTWGSVIASKVTQESERERRLERAIDDVIQYLRTIQNTS